MRILLLGANGQLGWELNRVLLTLGEVTAIDFPEIDVGNADSIRKWIAFSKPHLIINATAYTAVDKAESEPDLAMRINGTAPGILAQEAKAIQAAFIHYSTDYVFNGAKGSLYYESDQPTPLSVYGKSKLAGEHAVMQVGGKYLILRTSWVYSLRQGGFVNKFLDWISKKDTLTIVDDQIANPTWARMLAEVSGMLISRNSASLRLPEMDFSGLYHLAGSGYCSRLEWAQAILDVTGVAGKKLIPGKTADFPAPAERPLFSALDCTKFDTTFALSLPNWRDALRLALDAYPT